MYMCDGWLRSNGDTFGKSNDRGQKHREIRYVCVEGSCFIRTSYGFSNTVIVVVIFVKFFCLMSCTLYLLPGYLPATVLPIFLKQDKNRKNLIPGYCA